MTDQHDASIDVDSPPPMSPSTGITVHPIVQAAIRAGADAASLHDFLATQREWEAREALRLYTRALVRLKADLPAVINRDETVDYPGKSGANVHFTHSSLARVIEDITGPLCDHGFALTWGTATAPGSVTITCHLTHEDGHRESTSLSAPPDPSGSKNGGQAVASTATILERYTALALLGIATADQVDPPPLRPDPDHVDSARNLKAVAVILRRKLLVEDAEELVHRLHGQWTAADLDAIAGWLKEQK